jgi:hypothetical protein
MVLLSGGIVMIRCKCAFFLVSSTLSPPFTGFDPYLALFLREYGRLLFVAGECFRERQWLAAVLIDNAPEHPNRFFETISCCAVPVLDNGSVDLIFGSKRCGCCPDTGRSLFEKEGDRWSWQHDRLLVTFLSCERSFVLRRRITVVQRSGLLFV